MSRTWPSGHPIFAQTDAAGRPVTFVLSEYRYRLLRIEQYWEVDTDWWAEAGRVWRRYGAATTLEGVLVVLFYDVLREGWYLEKVYD
ncbi:MAG: hypothetical protein M9936_32290 [Caldilinea sp.]|nr:hypothetical protein [Caldilineaceae bacterium]MCO5214405.1 hypothetical protein [Caldilinea sp.]